MRDKLTMEMLICQAENGFSFDELVIKLSEACEKNALERFWRWIWNLRKKFWYAVEWCDPKSLDGFNCTNEFGTLPDSFHTNLKDTLP